MSTTYKLGPGSNPDIPQETWRVFCAAANGETESLKEQIQARPDLIHSQLWYELPLHYAVREGHSDIVQFLLDAGRNPARSNFTYSSWQSLLPIARERGFDEILTILTTEMKQRFNYDPDYEALWKAIVANDIDEVQTLISADPKLVNIGDEHGNRAIHWAVIARQIPIIQVLLDAGADINAKRADHQSPLHISIVNDYWFGKTNERNPDTSSEEVTQFLLKNGADYEFSAAVSLGDIDHVKAELAKDGSLAKKLNDSRRSPLYHAARTGQMEVVRLLLDHGADPNLPEECAETGRALFAASARNDIEMMTLLIEHGANADAYVDSCGNCLSMAEQGGEREAEALDLLKKHGAQPGEWTLDTAEKVADAINSDESFVPNRDLWSSILGKILEFDDTDLLNGYVARFGNESILNINPLKGWRLPSSSKMLEELIRHGADVNARDWYGRTYLHYAAFDETTERADWLLDAGVDINGVDHESGTTALGMASENGRLAMVEFLLDRGANALLPEDADWARPLSLAKKRGHDDVVARLQQGNSSEDERL